MSKLLFSSSYFINVINILVVNRSAFQYISCRFNNKMWYKMWKIVEDSLRDNKNCKYYVTKYNI